jgi:manganese transport protein
VTVGFIDPGNWATNIEGGSRFGYQLLWVITLSTIMLIVIQHMAAKLGIATGKSLAVNIRENFPLPLAGFLGVTIVIACVATDVAELVGGAIGFRLLFGTPLWLGAFITVLLEVFLIVSQRYHRLEQIIMGFLGIIAICYIIELGIVKPDWSAVAPSIVLPKIDRSSIYIAMAILGAVVMPHNIFLHSNVIHSRQWGISDGEKHKLLRYERFDTSTAMLMGWDRQLRDDYRGCRRLCPELHHRRKHRTGFGHTAPPGRTLGRLSLRHRLGLCRCRVLGHLLDG